MKYLKNVLNVLKEMNLTKYSRNKLLETFKHWSVPKDFADPMFNYLVYGYQPGSCFTSVLANDFSGAIMRSHPGNTVTAFKALAGWINDCVPSMARGSYDVVKAWTNLSDNQRRAVLEGKGLIFTSEEESWMILKDEPVKEVHLY
jgi:hypothetical protein